MSKENNASVEVIVDHQEHSECRACGEIYGVDPEKAAEAMYCPACEKKHRREGVEL